MKRFTQLLSESFNSPYKWRWLDKMSDMWTAEFHDKDDIYFSINFIENMKGSWDFMFGIPDADDPMGNTGNFDARRILSTVLSALKVFLLKKTPKQIKFSGNKEDGKDKLYRMLFKKLNKEFLRIGYKISEKDNKVSTKFTLKRT